MGLSYQIMSKSHIRQNINMRKDCTESLPLCELRSTVSKERSSDSWNAESFELEQEDTAELEQEKIDVNSVFVTAKEEKQKERHSELKHITDLKPICEDDESFEYLDEEIGSVQSEEDKTDGESVFVATEEEKQKAHYEETSFKSKPTVERIKNKWKKRKQRKDIVVSEDDNTDVKSVFVAEEEEKQKAYYKEKSTKSISTVKKQKKRRQRKGNAFTILLSTWRNINESTCKILKFSCLLCLFFLPASLAYETNSNGDDHPILTMKSPDRLQIQKEVRITCSSTTLCRVTGWSVKTPGAAWNIVTTGNFTFTNSGKYAASSSQMETSLKISNFSEKDLSSTYRCQCDLREKTLNFTEINKNLIVTPDVLSPTVKMENNTISIFVNIQNIYNSGTQCLFFVKGVKVQNISKVTEESKYGHLYSANFTGYQECTEDKCKVNCSIRCFIGEEEIYRYNVTTENNCKAKQHPDTGKNKIVVVVLGLVLGSAILVATCIIFCRRWPLYGYIKKKLEGNASQDCGHAGEEDGEKEPFQGGNDAHESVNMRPVDERIEPKTSV